MDKPKLSERISQDELERRCQQVEDLLDQGYKTAKIVQVMVQLYGVTPRQAFRYLEKVQERRAKFSKSASREAVLIEFLNQTKLIYRQNAGGKNPNHKIALKAIDTGFKLAKEINFTGGNEDEINTPTEDVLGNALEQVLGQVEGPAQDAQPE